jgi:hypothetical protein
MTAKRVAIVQSNYIPWKGYFDLIAAVDEFILFDDAQFTTRDWRNRNRIKTPSGLQWLTVPVGGDVRRRIRDVELPQSNWRDLHWKALSGNYRRAPHFREVAGLIEPIYRGGQHAMLSALNRDLIELICGYLGIATRITNSWDYRLLDGKSDRLAGLCLQAGASEYVSGPAARSYLDESPFIEHGVTVTWFDYAGYPEYPQLWTGFYHEVSILDLLFNCGRDSPRYMKYVRP